jgi:hypothetical protein
MTARTGTRRPLVEIADMSPSTANSKASDEPATRTRIGASAKAFQPGRKRQQHRDLVSAPTLWRQALLFIQ